jgi:phytoene dehydrogenase-like protein
VPEGGAGRLTDALVARLESRGGTVTCNAPVTGIVIRDRRAVAVTLADGTTVDAARAVVADVGAPALYLKLLQPRDATTSLTAGASLRMASTKMSRSVMVDSLTGGTETEFHTTMRILRGHCAEIVQEFPKYWPSQRVGGSGCSPSISRMSHARA